LVPEEDFTNQYFLLLEFDLKLECGQVYQYKVINHHVNKKSKKKTKLLFDIIVPELKCNPLDFRLMLSKVNNRINLQNVAKQLAFRHTFSNTRRKIHSYIIIIMIRNNSAIISNS
jgi:hypothetical protein